MFNTNTSIHVPFLDIKLSGCIYLFQKNYFKIIKQFIPLKSRKTISLLHAF